jgi:hypothetical protein
MDYGLVLDLAKVLLHSLSARLDIIVLEASIPLVAARIEYDQGMVGWEGARGGGGDELR